MTTAQADSNPHPTGMVAKEPTIMALPHSLQAYTFHLSMNLTSKATRLLFGVHPG